MSDRIDPAGLDGKELLAMLSLAVRLFESNIETIDALNVFPVPDGDTGTNMFMTLRDVVEEAEKTEQADSAGEVAAAMAQGALMGARGNSGVILSQVFRGLSLEMEGRPVLDANHLAHALSRARALAYRAVGKPVEGTLLTVIGAAADAAATAAAGSVLDVVEAACEAAGKSVALTPTKLKTLRDAGVVDAGGQGLLVILEGMRRYLAGGEPDIGKIAVPDPVGLDESDGAVSQEFLDTADDELYGYCIQFMLGGAELDADAVRDRMLRMARSPVVVGTETMLNVHVHADDAGPVLEFAGSVGAVSGVTVTDMDEQRRRFSSDRRALTEDDGAADPVAVVAVAWGDGNEKIFRDYGAVQVLRMDGVSNPSVGQLSTLIDSAGSEPVILLPNNPNVVPAANQVAALSEGRVRIVPTKTMPQGVAAILAFDDDRDLDWNLAAMERELSSIKTGEVCLAERAARVDGMSVSKGEVIGLLDRKLVAAGDEPPDVLLSLLSAADISGGDLITIYWGTPASADDAADARDAVRRRFADAEVELVRGGQHGYHYVISIE